MGEVIARQRSVNEMAKEEPYGNYVERFFRSISLGRLARDVFLSVPVVVAAIDEHVAAHNEAPKTVCPDRQRKASSGKPLRQSTAWFREERSTTLASPCKSFAWLWPDNTAFRTEKLHGSQT